MSTKTDLKRQLDELSALDNLIWAKRRAAGRELARLREIHPRSWRRIAGVDAATAEHLLKAAGRE